MSIDADTQNIFDIQKIITLPETKNKFLIGGVWYNDDKSSKYNLLKIAKSNNEILENGKFQSVALFETSQINEFRSSGLFYSDEKNCYSLAMIIAKTKEQNKLFVDAFTLTDENGQDYVWVVTVDNGIIQPNGDRIFEKTIDYFAEAKEIQETYPDVTIKHYQHEEAVNKLTSIVSECNKKTLSSARIISFQGVKKRIAFITIMLCIIIGILSGGYIWWSNEKAEEARIQEQIRIEENAKRNIESLKKSSFPPVWIKEPLPSYVISLIAKKKEEIEIAKNGWVLKVIIYKKGSISFIYTKDKSSIFLPPPGKTDPGKPNISTINTPLKLPEYERKHGIMSIADAGKWLMQISQGRPYKTTYKLLPVKSKTIPGAKSNVTVVIVASYQEYEFTISDIRGQVLEGLGKILDAPGVVIKTVTYNNGLWKIQGSVYALAK